MSGISHIVLAPGSHLDLLSAALNKLNRVPDAEFSRGDRTACMPGTRERLLDDLVAWALDAHTPPVFWLDGKAGTGKTTITESFCQRLHTKGILAGSFFCWRFGSSERKDVQRIIPSLAFSAASKFPALSEALVDVLEEDNDVVSYSLKAQFTKLLFDPLGCVFSSGLPTPVFVIDALDECEDQSGTATLIDLVLQNASSLHVKFFLTSRPEARIRTKFTDHHSPLHSILRLHDVEKVVVEADIELYFRRRLSSVSHGHRINLDGVIYIPASGGYQTRIRELVHRAGKLFIYASTTCEYVTSPEGDPKTRLDNLLHGGQPSRMVGLQLDGHYAFIMNEAMLRQDEAEIRDMRNVLCFVFHGREKFSIGTVALLLGIDKASVRTSLASLHSVIHVPVSDWNTSISAFHASFGDYLHDTGRSGSERWHIDYGCAHDFIFFRCLATMRVGLYFNVSSSISPNKSHVSALAYACRFWSEHLTMSPAPHLRSSHVLEFLHTKFLFWVELMVTLNRIHAAITILDQVLGINEVCGLLIFR